MKRYTALIICILLLLPSLFACEVTETDFEIPQRLFAPDGWELYTRLYSLYLSDGEKAKEEAENIRGYINNAGAASESIGGAEYDGKIYTEGDFTATDDDSLKRALEQAKAGDIIFIPSGVTIDMSDLGATETYTPKIPEGVILASDRGINAGGILKLSHPSGTLLVCNDNVTVTGLNLCGVIAPSGEWDEYKKDNGIRIDGKNIVVSNCEIAFFSKSGITTFPKGEAKITDCYIHHCETGVSNRDDGLTLEKNAFFKNNINCKNGDKECEIPEGNGILTEKAVPESVVERVTPDITSRVFPADAYEVYWLLGFVAEGRTDVILQALAAWSGTTQYYYYKDKISITQNNTQYGIRGDGNPLGGGKGYDDIITEGDYTVTDTASLISALREAKSGETVFVPADAKISITGLSLTVPEGVTLASDRGRIKEDGTLSTGGMLYTSTRQKEAITLSANAVITGLTVVGADTERHMTHLKRGLNSSGTAYTDYYYSLILSRGIIVKGDGATVHNCEISGFSEAGVLVQGSKGVKVHHCYIHHNQRNGFGYGVSLYSQSEVEIYQNIFNFDRHAIAADGSAGSSYSAHDNIHCGTAIYHIFDAHGGADRGDGTDIACDKVEMVNNVFLSDKLPYKKRGTPTEYSLFKHNIVIYPEKEYEYRYLYGNNFICEDNIFGIAEAEKNTYSFEDGKSYPFDMTSVTKYEDMEYIDSKTHGLRYKYILVFAPAEDGKYYICEYGNNLDDGSIRDWNEKVYIPEGGFVVTFSSENGSALRLYNAIAARHGVIYNTTLMLDGDYLGEFDGNLMRVTEGIE
ncbi:MAG: right-handed parallel beta-helix repeat-containing protein [Clostridia bacterium]|nr:right-handed parallel beta-helix repeat-containing protein [Clostridia bacterium]